MSVGTQVYFVEAVSAEAKLAKDGRTIYFH
jgi:hypothetical protein